MSGSSLVLKAARMPAYAHLVDEAVGWGIRSHTTHADRIAAATRRLAVLFGREATRIVEGRVSTEVDAHLSFETDASVAEARAVIQRRAARVRLGNGHLQGGHATPSAPARPSHPGV